MVIIFYMVVLETLKRSANYAPVACLGGRLCPARKVFRGLGHTLRCFPAANRGADE